LSSSNAIVLAASLQGVVSLTNFILGDNSDATIITLDHDHLALLENVISRYLGKTLLSCLPQNVMKLRLRVKKIIRD
jgi:hypothetical protein